MILVTGSAGFVGSSLVARLERDGDVEVVRAVRRAISTASGRGRWFVTGELTAGVDWRPGLRGVTTVIHAAARVHVVADADPGSLSAFRRVNVDATLNLARQAIAAGVRRFIFVSSVKVLGEATQAGRPFFADDPPAPENSYAVSKMEAERGLVQIADGARMETVIIRPPLVYGPGVGANFRDMMTWVLRGVPLPLRAIENQRSFVATDNLVDLIVTCARHPRAGNQTFMASDGEDLSTPQLLRRLGAAFGKPVRLLSVPPSLLQFGGTMLGRRKAVARLCSSLQVDIAKNRQVLGWQPPIDVDEGLRRTAQAFLSETHR